MKSFNILFVALMLWGMMPIEVSANSVNNGNQISVVAINEGGGYFNSKTNEVQANSYEYNNDVVSVQDIKLNADKYPLNVAVKSGNSVVVTTTGADIIATPHTLSASGWVQVDYKSKSFSGPAEVSFGFNGVDQVQMVKGETYESYEHTLYRQVDVVKTAEFKPTKIISTKTAGMPLDADTDISLNSKYAEIVYEQAEPMMGGEAVQQIIKLAYDTYDDKTGAYSYKYNGQDTETYYETFVDWKPTASSTMIEYKALAGTSRWNTLPSGTIAKDIWYSTRFWVELPFKGKEVVSGKYNIAIKQAGADLSTAVVLDPWYNYSWLYRKSIVIAHTADGAQTNYQMKLLVGKASGATGEEVDCAAHCEDDFDDLRFTKSDGTTLLYYWIESSGASGTSYLATVWIKVDAIAAHPDDTTIYMYYGNAGAAAVSNGATTFGAEKFDDFEAYNVGDSIDTNKGNITTWTKGGAGTSTSTVQNDPAAGSPYSKVLRLYRDGTNTTVADFNQVAGTDYAIRFGLYKDTTSGLRLYHGDGSKYIYLLVLDTEEIKYNDGAEKSLSTPTSVTADTWGIIDLTDINHTDITPKYDIWFNGTKDQNDAGMAAAATGDDHVVLRNNYGASTCSLYINYVIIRKWTANEPTWSSFGIEALDGLTISTLSATSITNTTAILGGNITALRDGNISQYGLQYGNTTSYGSWINSTELKTAVFSFTNTTTGLTSGELYYYRAFVNDTVSGISYGDVRYFQTKPNEPNPFVCATVNSTAISYSWTKGIGAINTTVRYHLGHYVDNITDGTFSYNDTGSSNTQTGLVDANTYYFSAWSVAIESGNVTYSDLTGNCSSLTYGPPTVTTTAASAVAESTATTGGTITASSFAITSYGVEYGLTGIYGTTSSGTVFPATPPWGYTRDLSPLTKGKLYYFRAFATHSLSIGYGAQLNFLTKPAPPVLTLTAINITAINISWVVGSGANFTMLRYSNTTGACPPTVGSGVFIANVTSSTATYDLNGLASLSTYYVSAWSFATEGGLEQQSTIACASQLVPGTPVVVTNVPTGYGNDWVSISGTQTGGYPVSTLFGFQYGPTIAYGSWSNTTLTMAGGYFSATVSGLVQSSSYHYRAFALNSYGIGYGADMTFSTAGAAILYENNLYGCNTTWSQVYESDASSVNTITQAATPIYGNNWTAQTFTTTQSHSVHQVVLWASRTSTAAAGYVYVSIREASTDNVTTPDLAIGLYAISYVSTSGGPIEVSLENEIQLDANKKYAIVVRAPGADATNYVSILSSNTTVSSSTKLPLTAGSQSEGLYSDEIWQGQANIYTDNSIYANITATTFDSPKYSTVLIASNYSHAVPTTATITGIEVVVEKYYANGNVTDAVVQLTKNLTTRVGSNYAATTTNWSSSVSNTTYGGPSDLWGTTWTPTEINSANFGVHFVAKSVGTDSDAMIDFIRVIVYYSVDGNVYATGNSIKSVNGGGLWQSYPNYDLFFSIIGRPQPIYGNVQAGQSFTVGGAPHTAYKIRLILGRIGQPGNIYVSLRNYTGGVVSNADLATVALNGNAITLDKAAYDCVLVPEKSLEAGKQYVIVLTAPSGDRYNYILMCADSGAGYADGVALISLNSGISWSTVASIDYNFEVWGNACLSVLNARVFKSYLVSGDWLITAETLNVTPPYYDSNQDPSSLFTLSFMSLTGTTYASTPCELWEKGPIVIYLNPTQASALTWGGNYKVRLGDAAGVIFSEYGLLSIDWSSSSSTYLDNWVRLVAKDMENYKTAKTGTSVVYLTYVADKGYVLNQDGGAIFNQACPRLSYVRPNIFQITSNQPDIVTSVVATPGTDKMDYHVRLGSYLSGLIDNFAAANGIQDPKTAGGIIIVCIYGFIAFATVMKGYAWAGLIAAFPVVLLGMWYGLLDPQLLLIILVIMAFCFVREFIWKGG